MLIDGQMLPTLEPFVALTRIPNVQPRVTMEQLRLVVALEQVARQLGGNEIRLMMIGRHQGKDVFVPVADYFPVIHPKQRPNHIAIYRLYRN